MVGEQTDLQLRLIQLWHSSAVGGHLGVEATYKKLKQTFYWKKMHSQVLLVVKACNVCQRFKYDNATYLGLLQQLDIPTTV